MMSVKRALPAIFIASVVAALAIFLYGARQTNAEKEQQLALARAVSVLPAGTEEAWTAYVDRRFAVAIEHRGGGVRVAALGDHILRKTTFVSRNTPYRLTCSPAIGAFFMFGQGDDSIMVPVYGSWAVDRDAEPPPALGVDKRSIAATHLSEMLCERISTRLNEIMKPASDVANR
jgi:hypothetical protein